MSSILFLTLFLRTFICYLFLQWKIITIFLILWLLVTFLIEQKFNFPKNHSFYKFLKKQINEPRTVSGALIGAFGTFLIFSPSIFFWDQWYDRNLPFYNVALNGLNKLSMFEFEPSEREDGYRQKVRTLNKGDEGFEEILLLLEKIDSKRVRDRSKVKKITNRRWVSRNEISGQFLDMINIMHVYDSSHFPPYSLVATVNEVRQKRQDLRNRLIEGWGTAFVILGIFFAYVWQGSIKISDWIDYTLDKIVWKWLKLNRVKDLKKLEEVRSSAWRMQNRGRS